MESSQSKAELAVRVMIEHPTEFSEVETSGNEYYFKFRGRPFSLAQISSEEVYKLYVYPKWGGSVSGLREAFEAGIDWDEFPEMKMITFTDQELGPRGPALLEVLYKSLESRYHGVDDIWDEIIGN